MSQVVEIAVEELLARHAPAADRIVTSRGTFTGSFSREDTYAGR